MPPKRPARAKAASEKAYRDALRAWRAARKTDRLEVNHVIACRGRRTSLDCLHHLDNLETLCVACHREHTARLALNALPRPSRTKSAASAAG